MLTPHMDAAMNSEKERAFAQRLKIACDNAGVPPMNSGRGEWLSSQMSVQASTISRWLAGQGMPQRANMEKLAKLLGVSLVWLERGERPEAAIDEPLLEGCIKGAIEGFLAVGYPMAGHESEVTQVVIKAYKFCTSENMGQRQGETFSRMLAMSSDIPA